MNKKIVAVLEVPVQETCIGTELNPTDEQIAVRAHELFVQRGEIGGHELEDWLEAERELRRKD